MVPGLPKDFFLQPNILQIIWKSLSTPIMIVRVSDLLIIEANTQAKNAFAEVCPNLIGEKADTLNFWPKVQKSAEFLRKLVQNPRIENFEANLYVHHDELAVFLISTETMDANGIEYRLIMMRDITLLKKIEHVAEERGKLFESLVYNLPHQIIIHKEGRILFANQAFINNFGIKEDTLAGQILETFLHIPLPQKIPEHKVNPQIGKQKAGQLNEIKYTAPDGTLKYFNFKTLPVRYQGQQAHISILVDITERKILEQAVLDKLLESEEKERSQYAADLHDDLGPILSAIKLYLSSIMDLLTGSEEVTVRLSKSINFIDEAIIKLKIITNNISSDSIGRFGLDSSLRTFIDKINWHGRLKINLKSNINDLRFSPKIETNIYRIISELINNSLQHSGAQLIDLRLNYSHNTLSLVYQDDGKGFDVKSISLRNTGSGIINMINRVNLLEGSIEFKEKNGKVTTMIRINTDPLQVN